MRRRSLLGALGGAAAVWPLAVELLAELVPHVKVIEAAPKWWTPLLSSDRSRKVSNGSGTASLYR